MIKFFEVGTDEMNGVIKVLSRFKVAIELSNDDRVLAILRRHSINKLNNLSSALLYKDCADFVEAFNLLYQHIEGLEVAVALYESDKVLNFFEANTEEYSKIKRLLSSIRFLADSFDQPDSLELDIVASVFHLSRIEVVYLFRLLLQHISGLEYAVALHQEALDDDLDEVLSKIYSKVYSEAEADHLKADEEAAHAIKEFHLQHAFSERSDIHG